MSYLKLDDDYQRHANYSYEFEEEIIAFIDSLESRFGKDRWLSIGRTNIEQGFMALRKGLVELNKSDREKLHEARKLRN
jgi:hypothetical protein